MRNNSSAINGLLLFASLLHDVEFFRGLKIVRYRVAFSTNFSSYTAVYLRWRGINKTNLENNGYYIFSDFLKCYNTNHYNT